MLIACRLLLSTTGEEASGMKLHEVLFAPCLSARPLFSCHRSIARASARTSVAGPLLVCHWSARVVVAVLSLSCHWSVAGLSLVHCWSVTGLLLVCRWSARVMAVGHGR